MLNHRVFFEEGNFPSETFGAHGRPLPAGISEEVKRRVPVQAFERYLRFLTYWGGFPGTLTEIDQIEPRVFSAFGLGSPRISSQRQHSTEATRKAVRGLRSLKEGTSKDSLEAKWERILEKWRGGVLIPQANANQLRKWIAEALKGFVEWDWDLYRPRKDATFGFVVQLDLHPSRRGKRGTNRRRRDDRGVLGR